MKPVDPLGGRSVPRGFKRVNYAEGQDEYRTLPALVHETMDRPVLSCWQLTWRERIALLITGKIFWTQLTFGDALQPQLPEIGVPYLLRK